MRFISSLLDFYGSWREFFSWKSGSALLFPSEAHQCELLLIILKKYSYPKDYSQVSLRDIGCCQGQRLSTGKIPKPYFRSSL